MPQSLEQQPQLQFLSCLECNNRGRLNRKTCTHCQGLGLVAWNGSELLYWSKRIDRLQLAQDKTKDLVKLLINGFLFIASAVGAIVLGLGLLQLESQGIPPWLFWQRQSWPLFGFWALMPAVGYLVYRFERDLERIRHIPKKPYEAISPSSVPITWEQAKALPKKQRVDIAQYFSSQARAAVENSWKLSFKYNHAQANPIHLLIALIGFDQTTIVFSRMGISFESLKKKIGRVLNSEPLKTQQPVTLSPRIQEITYQAYLLAWQLRQQKVTLAELLEALVLQQNEVYELLFDLGVDIDKIRNVIAWIRIRRQLRTNWRRFRRKAGLRPTNSLDRAMTAVATPVLNSFSQDLTQLAQAGYLMPCIGRRQDMKEIFRIMHGGTRRNALLIGNQGVGKTTIIEGIAQRMVEEDVPPFLQDKRLVSIDVARLISGADAAEAQQRLLIMVNEIRRSRNIILVIKNIHTMVGITAGREGSLDLAGVLAQVLQSGGVLAIATTTVDNYRRYIENVSVLDSVFEPVTIEEVTGNEAIQILEAKVGALEHHNQIFFSYDAIAQTVKLSDRYIHDRMLPEKAIEILQEVATRVSNQKGKNGIVSADDVAKLLSEKTNIPLGDISQAESEKLLNLEDHIHKRVVNQEEAVNMVAASLRRARAEMRSAQRPIVNLLFLGPTGVGKTELAKTVSAEYFGSEEHMIRVDMSEYQEKSSINRLIGAPPGFGDGKEAGLLTEAVRTKPFSLVLLDELEKAHPDILNVFLQVMDDGRLTDSHGRTIDFTSVILIATSNAATRIIQQKAKEGQSAEEIKAYLLQDELHKYFRPEFLNRFDGIVIFKPLNMEHVQKIAKLMLRKVADQLDERGISFQATPAAIVDLAQKGFSHEFGARSLRRVIQAEIQDALAKLLLAGKINRRDIVILDAGGKIKIEKAKPI